MSDGYRRIAGIAVALSLWAGDASADFGEYRSHVLDGPTVVIETSMGTLGISAVDDGALYVHYVEDGVSQLPSFALDENLESLEPEISDGAASIVVSTGNLTATVNKAPVTIAYSRNGEPLVAEEHGYFRYDTTRGFRFRLDDAEKIMGGGQRVLGMDRRGQRMPLYNRAHYGYETDSSQMYYSVPAIMSSRKYTIVFDNSASGWLDIAHYEPNVLQFEAVSGRTAYLVVAGDTYPELIGNYVDVTGRQPLPPRWAFGNFASRFGYRTEDETRDVVRRFRDSGIPLDAIVLDLYWFGPDIQGHMGNLDWDREAFPDPEKMIADFAADGVRTIAITEPFVLTASKNWDDAVENNALGLNAAGGPKLFEFYFGETGLIDVFNDDARAWFWRAYRRLFEQGAAGTWGDLGEPEVHPGDTIHRLSDAGIEATGDAVHNAFGHEWARMVYENQVRTWPQTRPVIVMRSGFAGTQRYGIVPWTGDVSRSWGGLQPQVELSLQMGLFGLAYTHSDLGGFAGGETFDPELYARWMQYGVFQPVYRPHAQEHIPAEPVFLDDSTRARVTPWIQMRYRLLPYIYTLAWENSTTGMPLMRPLFFEDEDDLALIDEKYAYLWGDAFLVAPVLDPGVQEVDVPVPSGVWFDFFDGERIEGGRNVAVSVDADTIPILVRAGSFVPMLTDDIQTTRDYSSDTLTLHYYADSSAGAASGYMYDDDGTSRSSLEDGAHEVLSFAATHGGELEIALARTGGDYAGRPDRRELTVVIHNWTAPAVAEFDGKAVASTYDEDRQQLTIPLDWDHDDSLLRIR